MGDINAFWERDWSESYSIPAQDSSTIVDVVAVDGEDKAIAYGQVRLFAEMMLFTDMQAPRRDRARAYKLMMEEGFRGIDRAGIKEAYALIKDMRFARLMAKRYGFQIIENPGVLLYRKME